MVCIGNVRGVSYFYKGWLFEDLLLFNCYIVRFNMYVDNGLGVNKWKL